MANDTLTNGAKAPEGTRITTDPQTKQAVLTATPKAPRRNKRHDQGYTQALTDVRRLGRAMSRNGSPARIQDVVERLEEAFEDGDDVAQIVRDARGVPTTESAAPSA